MSSKLLQATVCGILLATAGAVAAAPFSSFDPRSFGMGGTGVASGTSANAALFNPSLLATAGEDEDFSLEFPIIGARVADPDNFIDAVDAFDSGNYIQAVDDAVAAVNSAVEGVNAGALTTAIADLDTATTNLITGLQSLSNKALVGEAEASLVIGVPSKKHGASLFVRGWVVGGAQATFAEEDLATLTALADLAGGKSLGDTVILDADANIASFVDVRFATVQEVGLSLAREFNVGGNDVAIGITPKYVKVETYDFRFADVASDPTATSLDAADVNLDQGKLADSAFDLDIGIAKDLGNGWKSGVVIKNLVGQEFKTIRGNLFEIKPQARIGVSHQTDWTTVAFDLDLVENDPTIIDKDTGKGIDKATQYAAVGVELDIWDTLQLRGGYRLNMSDSDTNIVTAGFGLSPFGVHIDVALAGNDKEVGGSFQLGFRF